MVDTVVGYVRATDGSPAIKLGNWDRVMLSPDGKRVLAIDTSSFHYLLAMNIVRYPAREIA